eukprot:6193465-Pleurochrysis_carterae.AAC.1
MHQRRVKYCGVQSASIKSERSTKPPIERMPARFLARRRKQTYGSRIGTRVPGQSWTLRKM